jgi:hypothetical protein
MFIQIALAVLSLGIATLAYQRICGTLFALVYIIWERKVTQAGPETPPQSNPNQLPAVTAIPAS